MSRFTRRHFIGLTAAGLGAVLAKGCDSAGDGSTCASDIVTGDALGAVCTPDELPVLAETDVLVVGGGPSGLAAAISAAKAGAKTMLVERYGFYGGVISQSIMGSITWWRYANTVDAGGVCADIEAKAKLMGGSINLLEVVDDPVLRQLGRAMAEEAGLIKDGKPTYEILRSELFKAVADAMVLEAGVTPILHAWAVGAVMDGTTIKGIITESKSGRQTILARRVIDATGDADIAAFAGAPFAKAATEELMEVTTNFSCSNVNLPKFIAHVAGENRSMSDWIDEDCGKEKDMFSTHLFQVFKDAQADGELPQDVEIRCFPGGFTAEGTVLSLNAVHFHGIDCTNVMDLTWAEMEGRRRSLMVVDILKKRVPGFEEAQLAMFGSNLGCRESRKITGSYYLTGDDVKNEARFEDTIGIFPEFLDGYGILCLPTTGRYYQVPFGITVPDVVDNLLVVGRAVSGDRVSHASTRQMGCCMVTGQGAGVASALSLKEGTTSRDIDIKKVQDELKLQGVRLT